jgi:hypothetical protein
MMKIDRMKIYYLIMSFVSTFLAPAFGQDEPKILLNEGEVNDTTVARINGNKFGFKIDWGQGDSDTIKYEFIHARGTAPYDRSKGYLIGEQLKFSEHDISRVLPGNRLVFNLDFNGKKFSRSYHVLSTKASESKPWFFNVYFMLNGDTLNSDSYEIFFRYPKDSLNTQPARLERDKGQKCTKYYFSYQNELPPTILIQYKEYYLVYDFIASNFFHGDILLKYIERKKRPRKERWDYNSEIKFFNIDAVGWDRSQLFYQ